MTTPSRLRPARGLVATNAPPAPVVPPPAPSGPLDVEVPIQVKCDHPVSTGTVDGKPVSKPCVKAKGHDTDVKDDAGKVIRKGTAHSWRAYEVISRAITASALDTVEDVPADIVLDRISDGGRDELQLRIDNDVKASHDKWAEMGKPDGFNEAIKKGAGVKRYFIDPQEEKAFRARLADAGRLHSVRVRIVGPKRHEDGRTMLYWVAKDKKAKTAPRATSGNDQAHVPDRTGGQTEYVG